MRGLIRQIERGRAASRKAFLPAQAYTAGYRGASGVGDRARVRELQKSAGGTDETVTWVYACVKKIRETGSTYPWALHEFTGNIDAPGDLLKNIPPELLRNVALPNPRLRMTRKLKMQFVLSDLEVSGNSYWLKDQRNALGQPLEQYRLRPELVKIAKDRAGNKLGYVYYPLGSDGTGVPYDLDEVLHYRYPSLLDDLYGMGTVEAIIRTVNTELAQSAHVLGFFDAGGQVGGLLVTTEDLGEEEFQGLKEEFQAELEESTPYSILMVEQGMDFKATSIAPPGTGVIELRKQSKDEILSGFGMSEFMLGGASQSGTERMQEATHIFHHSTMAPKVGLIAEQETLDLTALWNAQLAITVTYSEPASAKAETAGRMLEGGASVNQALTHMGLPESDHPDANKPMVKSGVKPLGEKEVQRVQIAQGAEEEEEEEGTEPGEGEPEVPEDEVEDVAGEDDKRRGAKGFEIPEYPEGFEEWGELDPESLKQVGEEAVGDLLNEHARVLRRGVVRMRSKFVTFFGEQEQRVLARLEEFEKSRRKPGGGDGRWERVTADGKALKGDSLWDPDAEDAALRGMYMPIVDEVGKDAVGTPNRLLGMTLSWDLEHPHIAVARDRIGQKIKRVNETTRKAIAGEVDEGLRRGYPIARIANGFADEGYSGIRGVFSSASAARAETIARTETAYVYNSATTAGYRDAGVERVLVIDGTGDPVCADASGSIWPMGRADIDLLGHPNCVRTFAPLEPELHNTTKERYGDPVEGDEASALLGEGWFARALSERPGTRAQQEAINSYTGAGYHSMNGALRTGGPIDPEVRERIDLLESVIADAPALERPVKAYRGIYMRSQSESGPVREFIDKLKPGAVVDDPAFLSVAADFEGGASYVFGAEDVLLELVVPKGKRGLWVGGPEKELVLPPGNRIRITHEADEIVHHERTKRRIRGVVL